MATPFFYFLGIKSWNHCLKCIEFSFFWPASASITHTTILSLGFLHYLLTSYPPCANALLHSVLCIVVILKQKSDQVTSLLSKPSKGFPTQEKKEAFHIWPLALLPLLCLLHANQLASFLFLEYSILAFTYVPLCLIFPALGVLLLILAHSPIHFI